MQNLDQFVRSQLLLLDLERQAEVEQSSSLQENVSAKEREQRGVCLRKLKLVGNSTGLGGRSLIKLEHVNGENLPPHKMGVGDIVLVRKSIDAKMGKKDTDSMSGVIYRANSNRLTIALEDFPEAMIRDGTLLAVDKIANEITFKRCHDAIENLLKLSQHHRVMDVLFGGREPMYSPIRENDLISNQMNGSQKEAIHFSLSAQDISLIHGPPGTGKTTTVVEFIVLAVSRGERVLACGPSNISVDNILERLVSVEGKNGRIKPKVVRVGHPARVLPQLLKHTLDHQTKSHENSQINKDIRTEISNVTSKLKVVRDNSERNQLRFQLRELRQDLRAREDKIVDEILKNADVILSTNTGAGDPILKDCNNFDWVVIDEAAQALEASCWIPIIKGNKLLLAGDHCQLPPTILNLSAQKKGLELTLFERVMKIWGEKASKMLTIQYRMHETIMNWSSDEFYSSRMTADKSVARHLLKDLEHAKETRETKIPILLIDTCDCSMEEEEGPEGESKWNQGEVSAVFKHVRCLLLSGLKQQDVGVITPYNAQVSALRLELHKLFPLIEIGSVDGFQGREKEAIIISMVRSNPPPHIIGFLSEDRRTNVAITRAKRHVAIIADSKTIEIHPFLSRMVSYFKKNGIVRSGLDYLENVDDEILSQEILEEEWIQNIEDDEKKAGPSKPRKDPKKARENRLAQEKERKQKKEEADKLRQEKLEKQLEALANKENSESVIEFPSSLTSWERHIVHTACERLELNHTTTETNDGLRKITVSRKPEKDSSKDITIRKVSVENENEEENEKGNEEQSITEQQTEENNNQDNESDEENEEETTQQKEKKKKKKKKNKVTTTSEPKPETKTEKGKKPDEKKGEENIDEVLAELGIDNKRCKIGGCDKSFLINRVCEFCGWKYCIYHGLPEAHGCGDAAKRKARQQWKKDGKKIVTGIDSSPKPLKDWERSLLKTKLDKKIQGKEKDRSKKAEPKKK